MAMGRASVWRLAASPAACSPHPATGFYEAREGCRRARLGALDDHRLHVGRGVLGELDLDEVGADVADRLDQVDLALVDPYAAGVANCVGDLARGHRAVQAAVGASLGGDGEDGLGERLDLLLRALTRLGGRAIGRLLLAP